MLELDRTEVTREMDKLANEDHTHITTEEELNVYRSNWWIRSNFVGSDTMPSEHRPDFKKALSNLHRLKKAEDEADYQNWWQSSPVKGMYPAPYIHEHFTIHKWIRQTAYIFTDTLNNLEHIANNCMSAMTHTDVTTAHH